jgi:hypothetical protein
MNSKPMRSLLFLSFLVLLTTKCLGQETFSAQGKQGYLTADGSIILPAIYDTVFVVKESYGVSAYLFFGNKKQYEEERSINYQLDKFVARSRRRTRFFKTEGWLFGILELYGNGRSYNVPHAKYIRIDLFENSLAAAYLPNGMIEVYRSSYNKKEIPKPITTLTFIETFPCGKEFIYKRKKHYGIEGEQGTFSKKEALLAPKYDTIIPIYAAYFCRDPIYGYKIRRKGKWGYVNEMYEEKDWGYDSIIIKNHTDELASSVETFMYSKKGREEKLHYLGNSSFNELGAIDLSELGLTFEGIEELELDKYNINNNSFFIRVKTKGKWGVLHYSMVYELGHGEVFKCNWFVKPIYDEIKSLAFSALAVRNGDYWGLKTGGEAMTLPLSGEGMTLPLSYESIQSTKTWRQFLIQKDGKYGLAEDSLLLLEQKYDTIQDQFIVEKGLWGIFDGKDKVLLSPLYDSIHYLKNKGNLAIAYLKEKVYSLNLTTFETEIIQHIDRLFSFVSKEKISLDSLGFLKRSLEQYPLIFVPKLNVQQDTLRREGFCLSYKNRLLTQKDEQTESYWERPLSKHFLQANYWMDINEDGLQEILLLDIDQSVDQTFERMREGTWSLLDGKTGGLLWTYKQVNSVNWRMQFFDLNKDETPDFIFRSRKKIEVVDGQDGAILLSHNWRRKGNLYSIDTSTIDTPIFYCLGDNITTYKDKQAQIYSNYQYCYGFPFVSVGGGFALVANSYLQYGSPFSEPVYCLYKMPKEYIPNPKLNRMELEKPTDLELPGYHSSSFFIDDNDSTLIGIATNMGIIGLYNQDAQLVGLYQGPIGLVSLELKETEEGQGILIKTNRKEIYSYKVKNNKRLWQGKSY